MFGLILSFAVASPAYADVNSQNPGDESVIRVIQVDSQTGSKLRRFELCEDRAETRCRRLGNRDYSVSELKVLARRNYAIAAGKVLGDAALVAGAVLLGAQAGTIGAGISAGVAGGASEGAASSVMFAGAATGVVAGAGGAGVVIARYINPMENIRRALALRDPILEDRDVRVSNVAQTAKSLERALESAPAASAPRGIAGKARP